jgi:hypothetical protein
MPGALCVVNPTYSSDAANRIRDGDARACEAGWTGSQRANCNARDMGWNAAKGARRKKSEQEIGGGERDSREVVAVASLKQGSQGKRGRQAAREEGRDERRRLFFLWT